MRHRPPDFHFSEMITTADGKENRKSSFASTKPRQFPQRIPIDHTREEWLAKIRQHGMVCHYCELPLTVENLTKDHLTPICRKGSDKIDNIVPACLPCNQMKAWRTEEEFLEVREFLSTRRTNLRGMPNPKTCLSLEERFDEPGLLRKVKSEREKTSWAWRHPA